MTFNKNDDIIDINDLDLSNPVTIYIYEIKEVYKIKNTNNNEYVIYDKNYDRVNINGGLSTTDFLEDKKYYAIRTTSCSITIK